MRPRDATSWLFKPVDISWLVYFRIGFGVLMVWQAVRYLSQGWVRKNWIGHDFHFKFPLFEWVQPLPGDGMIVLFWVLAALALFVAAGFLYRLTATLLFLGHAYVFLIEKACYQNHAYLILLLLFLSIFLPANRSTSVDALMRPKIRSQQAPTWTLWLLRFQIAVPYFFGGIAKLNADWFRGEPLREWLPRKADFPIFGPHFANNEDWAIYLFSYSGLMLDLLAVPLLLWRRTRLMAFAGLFLFHCSNARLFALDIFPWMMIVLTAVFLAPDLPRRICRDLWPLPGPRLPCRRGWVAVVGAAGGVIVALWFLRRVELPAIMSGTVGGAILLWSVASRLRSREA